MSYTDVHRLFLQIMMSSRVLTQYDALVKYQQAFNKFHDAEENQVVSLDDMEQLISKINSKISVMKMEIRSGVCETTGIPCVILVNMVSTPLNRTMTKYSGVELQFFKKIIDEIVGSEGGKVSTILCLNLKEAPKTSKSDNELLIRRFVEDMWLLNIEGKLSLSVRSIAELDSYLNNTYKDYLLKCILCKNVVFRGFRCENCTAIGHMHCFRAFANRYKDISKVKCSRCKAVMLNLSGFLATDAAAEAEEGEDSEEKSEEEEEVAPAPPLKKKSRSSRRFKAKT